MASRNTPTEEKELTRPERRTFIKVSALAGGGMLLGFNWLAGCTSPAEEVALAMPKEWHQLTGFLKIGENGVVTIMSPNPEIGQNVKTSMPMIVAEELDIDWKQVLVEQAPLDTSIFTRQLAGGSQSIRQGWQGLRTAGATARTMLKQATANQWKVPVEELSTEPGVVIHSKTGKKAGYGELAALAAALEVPKDVKLKTPAEFKIIGQSKKNVDLQKIITGQPLFGLDYKVEGMKIAMVIHPPAFGLKLKSYDAAKALTMPGIEQVFEIKLFPPDYKKSAFDNTSFNELIVVVGKTTWEVMQAKKTIVANWEPISPSKETRDIFGRDLEVVTPAGLESTGAHMELMAKSAKEKAKTVRKDGQPEKQFKEAATILERTYTAPYLAHSTMEPMNFFAHVTNEKANLVGPIQTPEIMEKSIATLLGMPLEKVDIQMTRMGGGFGRRLYGHFLIEAALISQKIKQPVKLVYTREDDMTGGIYRPTYHATYRAAFDNDKNLTGFHVISGGIPESPLAANRFPAGAIEHYHAEDWSEPSNISTGAFRAPRSNFIAGAEQSFLDEVAEFMGKDPIAFRLELLEKAKNAPVGKDNDYDPVRYAGVLQLVKEKSNWGKEGQKGIGRGVAAYFCHNTYVAEVVDLEMKEGKPLIHQVIAAVDCGIVVNPDAAKNLSEGGIVDGIGHGLYSAITFENGATQQRNFDGYQLIRMGQAPKKIEVHFVKSDADPTGLGEPLNPPVIGALANAIYRAAGKRVYQQPFMKDQNLLG